jgi:hypothetical protein
MERVLSCYWRGVEPLTYFIKLYKNRFYLCYVILERKGGCSVNGTKWVTFILIPLWGVYFEWLSDFARITSTPLIRSQEPLFLFEGLCLRRASPSFGQGWRNNWRLKGKRENEMGRLEGLPYRKLSIGRKWEAFTKTTERMKNRKVLFEADLTEGGGGEGTTEQWLWAVRGRCWMTREISINYGKWRGALNDGLDFMMA